MALLDLHRAFAVDGRVQTAGLIAEGQETITARRDARSPRHLSGEMWQQIITMFEVLDGTLQMQTASTTLLRNHQAAHADRNTQDYQASKSLLRRD